MDRKVIGVHTAHSGSDQFLFKHDSLVRIPKYFRIWRQLGPALLGLLVRFEGTDGLAAEQISCWFRMVLRDPLKESRVYQETRPDTRHKMLLAGVWEKALRTVWRTDGRTDTPSYRDATSHLKSVYDWTMSLLLSAQSCLICIFIYLTLAVLFGTVLNVLS